MAAAASILFDEGIRGITFEKVASKAGASKMTLYKWWDSPGALAFDAYFDSLQETLAFPDTGCILADLRTQLHSFVDVLTDKPRGSVIAEFIGAAQSDPGLAEQLHHRYTAPRRLLAVTTLRLAQSRGQVRESVDPETLIDQLWGACYHRLLLPARPLSHQFADRLIDNVFAGIAGTKITAPH